MRFLRRVHALEMLILYASQTIRSRKLDIESDTHLEAAGESLWPDVTVLAVLVVEEICTNAPHIEWYQIIKECEVLFVSVFPIVAYWVLKQCPCYRVLCEYAFYLFQWHRSMCIWCRCLSESGNRHLDADSFGVEGRHTFVRVPSSD